MMIPKKYMLILQKRGGGQEAVEFINDGEAFLIPIVPFSDKILQTTISSQKQTKIQKNTLAFYDALTNKFKSFDHFMKIFKKEIYPFDYKPTKSYIGFLNKNYIHTVNLSFNDATLAHIALVADGNNINKRDDVTIAIVSDLVDMIEDNSCDFVPTLKRTFQEDDKKYNFTRSLVDCIDRYYTAKREYDIRNKNGQIMNDSLVEDIEIFKGDFLTRIESYKTFRELYRFRKDYLLEKRIIDAIKVFEPTEEKQTIEDEDAFSKRYEEVRQKTYYKAQNKNNDKIMLGQVAGQLSMFD